MNFLLYRNTVTKDGETLPRPEPADEIWQENWFLVCQLSHHTGKTVEQLYEEYENSFPMLQDICRSHPDGPVRGLVRLSPQAFFVGIAKLLGAGHILAKFEGDEEWFTPRREVS